MFYKNLDDLIDIYVPGVQVQVRPDLIITRYDGVNTNGSMCSFAGKWVTVKKAEFSTNFVFIQIEEDPCGWHWTPAMFVDPLYQGISSRCDIAQDVLFDLIT